MINDIIYKISRQCFYIEVAANDPTFVNDGVNGLLINGLPHKRYSNSAPTSTEAGIKVDGTNQAVVFQSLMDNINLPELRLHGGEITISGSANAVGKTLTFAPGTKIKTVGVGVVNGGIIDADDFAHIFTGTQNVNPQGYAKGYSTIMHYGAARNTGLDQSGPIAKCIAVAVKSNTPVVKFPAGNFNIKNIPIANYSGGNAQYVTITLEGITDAVAGSAQPVTKMECMDPKGVGFALQMGVKCEVINIAFEGRMPSPNSCHNVVTWGDAQWTNNGEVLDSRYAVHTGFLVDGCSANTPVDGRYTVPELAPLYTSTTYTGTSSLRFKGCAFNNFPVGAMINCSGYIANGDNIVFEDCWYDNNRFSLSSGSLQARGNLVLNGYAKYGEAFFIGNRYGEQQGTPPDIIGLNLAGGWKYLGIVNSPHSGFDIKCYAESVWSLGVFYGQPANFNQCRITRVPPSDLNYFQPPVFVEGETINFVGGMIEAQQGSQSSGFAVNCKAIKFDGTEVRGGPVFNTNQYRSGSVGYQGVKLANIYYSSHVWEHQKITRASMLDYIGKPIMPGTKIEADFTGITYECTGEKIEKIFCENAAITVNSVNFTASFTSSKVGMYRIGEVLATNDASITAPGTYYAGTNVQLGFIATIVGNVVTLADVPLGLTNATYGVYLTRIPLFQPRAFGNTTLNQTSVNGVVSEGFIAPGMRLKGRAFQPGTYIQSVQSATQFTLSLPAVQTANQVPLLDAEIKATATNKGIDSNGNSILAYNPILFPGDEIFNVKDENWRSMYCTKAGKLNTAQAPTLLTTGAAAPEP